MRKPALLILLIGFTVVFFSSSIKNTLQVFFVPMAESFGQSRGEFAAAPAIFMLVFGIASPIIGLLSDRIGPRNTILVGLVASGLAMLGAATTTSLTVFIVLYGVVCAFGLTAMSYVPLGLLVEQSYSEKHRGLAYATLTNGAAIGFVVLSPVWVFSQSYFNWQQIYYLLGMLFLLPLAFAVYWALPGKQQVEASSGTDTPMSLGQRVSGIFRVRPFYALMLGFMGCGVTMAFIDVHMVAYLQDLKLTPGEISLALSLLGVLELIGGFLAGWMCDRYSKRYVIAGNYLLRALSLFILLWFPNVVGVMIFAALFGLSYLGTVIGTSMYTLGLFGRENKGLAFGFIWFVHQIGAFFSTQLGANAFDWFGNYQWTIAITALIAVFSFVVSLAMLPKHPTPTAK